MIKPVYDDEGIVQDCEEGWRRFCADLLSHSIASVSRLEKRSRAPLRHLGPKEWQELIQLATTWRWLLGQSGSALPLAEACEMVDIHPDTVRNHVLRRVCNVEDINKYVTWVLSRRILRRRTDEVRRVVGSIKDRVESLARNRGAHS